MEFFYRFKYAFGLLVLTVFICGITDMFLALDIGQLLFSPWFGIPVFAVAWLLAPWISSKIAFK